MAIDKRWTRFTLAAVTVLSGGVLITGPAHAQSLALLQCQGTESDAYRPGVTFQARNIDIRTEARFGSCIGDAPGVTSGSYGERFTLFAGCALLLDGFHGPRTITWNTGGKSVIDASGSSTAAAGQVITTITGIVQRGRFHGRRVVEVITLPQPGVRQCLTTGVTHASGPTTLTVI
jgi:hypothetical protein